MKNFTEVLQSSSACLDSLKNSTGDISSLMDTMSQLDAIIKERDQAVLGVDDLSDSLSITEEMLDDIPNPEMSSVLSLPSVPNIVPYQEVSSASSGVSPPQNKTPVLVESE